MGIQSSRVRGTNQEKSDSDPAIKAECPISSSSNRHPLRASSTCPVQEKEVYNVYGQRINPNNMMPSNPDQERNMEQKFPLPQKRTLSSIPKGNTDETWLYPSEQMFFNALKRKGKGDDVHEGDIPHVVSVHNSMNERTWAELIRYEQLLHPDSEPKLLKFCGRPDDLSPTAWIKYFLGYGKPFDRHDWIIMRKDNAQVRYVIDYYYDDSDLGETSSESKISVYVRPAVDSFSALLDRIKHPIFHAFREKVPATLSQSKLPLQTLETEDTHSKESFVSLEEMEISFNKIKSSCETQYKNLDACNGEIECTQAATALQFCMARIICPTQAQLFSKSLKNNDEEAINETFVAMNNCMELHEQQSYQAMRRKAFEDASNSRL